MSVPTKKKLIEFLGDNYEPSDDQLIDLYLENHKIYTRMKKELKSQDLMMEYTNKAGATNLTKNPLLIEIPKYVTILNHLLKSMGLTPAQRKKVIEEREEDGFDTFVNER